MEQKTAEEILRENGVTVDGENITQGYYNAVVYAMKLFTDQQVDKAIDKALEMCANLSREMIYDRDKLTNEQSKGLVLRNFQVCYATPKQEILSLKPEILKELKK